MGFCRFLTHPYVSLWVIGGLYSSLNDSNGYSWVLTVSLCVFMDSNGSLWVLIGLYACLLVLMGPYKPLCVLMDSNGFLCVRIGS